MSSNLTLPQSQTNLTLENNLAALFKRYPHEKARLEPILKKPAKLYQLTHSEMPACPSNPPIRVILLKGIGNPVFLATLLNDRTVQQENFRVFIFEQDPEFIAFCFQNADMTQIINSQKTEWFLCHSIESIKPALFQALKTESVTSVMLNVQGLEVTVSENEEFKKFYDILPNVYLETCNHTLHNHGNLDDSIFGLELTIKNKDRILKSSGIQDLKDYYKGCAALVVGAGPSLDENLDMIKATQDKFVIIAADASLKPLRAKGIRVDYVTSIERSDVFQLPFFRDLPPQEAELVAFPVVHPEVLDAYPGNIRFVYRNYSFYAYFEKAFPKGILKSGGSTCHLGVRLADYMGCSKIAFVGLDSCYGEKDGLYRSHCSDLGYPDWGTFMKFDELLKVREHQFPLTATANDGSGVKTNITYYQWAKEYSEELAMIGHRVSFTNCAARGIKISGIPYKPLSEVAATLDVIYHEKPKAIAPTSSRAWSNKELVKNLRSWLELSNESIKEADELLTQTTIDPERFNGLFYIQQFRMIIDSLFVSFVIQCCARDFFTLDNEWWGLSLDMTVQLKEKTANLKKRFELYKKTLEKLIAALNEGEGIENE